MTSASRIRCDGAGRAAAAALLIAGAAMLPGCSSHAIIDSLPASIGGLPESAPERPATPRPYPAVHDMPPLRADTPMSEVEKKRLREELIATRERAEREGASVTATGSAPPAGTARNP